MNEKDMTLDESVVKALEIFEARQAEKAAKAAAEEEALLNAAKAQKFDELLAEREKDEAWKSVKGSVAVKKETKLGFADEDKVLFSKYLRMEVDDRTARKALQEGDGAEGGYLVPNDYAAGIVELRDPLSFPRRMGVQQIVTSRDNIDIPAEATSFTKFARIAEEGTYSTNDPAFAQNNVIPQKWVKLFKVSEELVEDDAYNLEGFLQSAIARAVAQTEAYYVAVGSGSSQHLGIFEGGDTDALTFDSAGNITPDEIWELFYTLGTGYHPNAAWLMDNQTWRYILSIRDTNNWAFATADMASVNAPDADGMLCGKRVFLQDDIPAITASTAVIAFGDPFYYALVDKKGLSVQVLKELYAASGQIAYKCHFRQSGTVLYEKAWVCGVMHA